MPKEQMHYCDVTKLSKSTLQAVLNDMKKGYTVRYSTKVLQNMGRGRQKKLVEKIESIRHSPVEIIWTQEVGNRVILYGYMNQSDCPLPFLDKPRTKRTRAPKKGNGGIITDEEWYACLK